MEYTWQAIIEMREATRLQSKQITKTYWNTALFTFGANPPRFPHFSGMPYKRIIRINYFFVSPFFAEIM